MKHSMTSPSYLIQGPEQQAAEHAEHFVQSALCSNGNQDGCFCTDCRKIKNNQHHAVIWLEPSKEYINKDIDVIFEKTQLALDQGEHFFFIITKAHYLSQTCANRLLKIIEEPPAGYHFIFLTDNKNALLSTITSRCLVTDLNETTGRQLHPLLGYFLDAGRLDDPIGFAAMLRKESITHTQARDLSHDLLEAFHERYAQLSANNELETAPGRHTSSVLVFLNERLTKPAQSGSAQIFFKSLYLSFPRE